MNIKPIVERAWNESKHATDPPFVLCVPDHQARLLYKAEGVKRTGVCEDPFDHAFKRLLREAKAEEVAPVIAEPVMVTLPEPVTLETINAASDGPADVPVLAPKTPAEFAASVEEAEPEPEAKPKAKPLAKVAAKLKGKK
jgi:hypothetical protein